MKKLPVLILSVLLILSFFVVLFLCDSDEIFLNKYALDQYEKILEIPAPPDESLTFTMTDNLPLSIKVEQVDTNGIQIYASKNINERQRGYLREKLVYEFNSSAEEGFAYLDLYIKDRLIINIGQDWMISQIIPFYRTLFDDKNIPLLKVIIPMEYTIDQADD